MKEYVVKRVEGVPTEEDWENANIAEMNENYWTEFTYKCESFAKVLYNDEAIYVRMRSNEMPVVAKYTERFSPVCLDSCMEFFFAPDLNKEDFFMNIEVNALGAFTGGAGVKGKRVRCEADEIEQFEIKPCLYEDGWGVSFKVPFDYIKKYAGECTDNMKGNFYKCGSETGHRHYGMWNMIKTEKPDFHRPEFFGNLIFEK